MELTPGVLATADTQSPTANVSWSGSGGQTSEGQASLLCSHGSNEFRLIGQLLRSLALPSQNVPKSLKEEVFQLRDPRLVFVVSSLQMGDTRLRICLESKEC